MPWIFSIKTFSGDNICRMQGAFSQEDSFTARISIQEQIQTIRRNLPVAKAIGTRFYAIGLG